MADKKEPLTVIGRLNDRISEALLRCEKNENLGGVLKRRIDKLDPATSRENFKKLEADLDSLHVRLRIMIAKLAVATELNFVLISTETSEQYRELITTKVIPSFDEADKWWKSLDTKNIEVLLQMYLKYNPPKSPPHKISGFNQYGT